MRILLCFLALALVSVGAIRPRGKTGTANIPIDSGSGSTSVESNESDANDSGAAAVINDDVEGAFKNYSIVPNIIPVAPRNLIFVRFDDTIVRLGTVVCAYDTFYIPVLGYDGISRFLYTLIYLNVDASYIYNRSYELVYLNYLIVNIPGERIYKGDIILANIPMLPLPGTRLDRGVFLLYRQTRRIDVTTNLIITARDNRTRFNLTEFVNQNRLGNPVAGNFYLSRINLCGCKEVEATRTCKCPKKCT